MQSRKEGCKIGTTVEKSEGGAGLKSMIVSGGLITISGLWLIRLLMDNAGKAHSVLEAVGIETHYAMMLTMIGTFTPLWLGGAIGWAVGAGAGGGDRNPRLRSAVAAAFAVPVIVLDPWAIVALGVGDRVWVVLKMMFLLAPVALASVLAYSGWSEVKSWPAKPVKNVALMLAVTVVIYLIIYWLILPWGNPTAIPSVPK